tara:strand:+ start:504 stop:632 length:129 start_codon:yes stop_codon:yes gene_type:complete
MVSGHLERELRISYFAAARGCGAHVIDDFFSTLLMEAFTFWF